MINYTLRKAGEGEVALMTTHTLKERVYDPKLLRPNVEK